MQLGPRQPGLGDSLDNLAALRPAQRAAHDGQALRAARRREPRRVAVALTRRGRPRQRQSIGRRQGAVEPCGGAGDRLCGDILAGRQSHLQIGDSDRARAEVAENAHRIGNGGFPVGAGSAEGEPATGLRPAARGTRGGEDQAASAGLSVHRMRIAALLRCSLLTAVTVAFVGPIGFIGLVGPHIARLLLGEDHRFYLPGAALTGALLLSLAAIASKLLIAGVVIPVGIVTAMIGVPVFVALIVARRRRL